MRKQKQPLAGAPVRRQTERPRIPQDEIQIGEAQAQYTRRSNIDKAIVAEGGHRRPLTSKVERYQATADRLGISLEAALQTLPRDGITVAATYGEQGTFCSVHVSVSLSQTVPDYDSKSRLDSLKELQDQADYVCNELLEEMKGNVFGAQ